MESATSSGRLTARSSQTSTLGAASHAGPAHAQSLHASERHHQLEGVNQTRSVFWSSNYSFIAWRLPGVKATVTFQPVMAPSQERQQPSRMALLPLRRSCLPQPQLTTAPAVKPHSPG